MNSYLNPNHCIHCGRLLAKGYNLCADCDVAMKAKLMAYKTQPLARRTRRMRLWVKMTLTAAGIMLMMYALYIIENLPNAYVQHMNNR